MIKIQNSKQGFLLDGCCDKTGFNKPSTLDAYIAEGRDRAREKRFGHLGFEFLYLFRISCFEFRI